MSNIPRTVYHQKELTSKQQDLLFDLTYEFHQKFITSKTGTVFIPVLYSKLTDCRAAFNYRNFQDYKRGFIHKYTEGRFETDMVITKDGARLPYYYFTSLPTEHKNLYLVEKSVQGALKLRKRYLDEYDEKDKKRKKSLCVWNEKFEIKFVTL